MVAPNARCAACDHDPHRAVRAKNPGAHRNERPPQPWGAHHERTAEILRLARSNANHCVRRLALPQAHRVVAARRRCASHAQGDERHFLRPLRDGVDDPLARGDRRSRNDEWSAAYRQTRLRRAVTCCSRSGAANQERAANPRHLALRSTCDQYDAPPHRAACAADRQRSRKRNVRVRPGNVRRRSHSDVARLRIHAWFLDPTGSRRVGPHQRRDGGRAWKVASVDSTSNGASRRLPLHRSVGGTARVARRYRRRCQNGPQFFEHCGVLDRRGYRHLHTVGDRPHHFSQDLS